MSALVVIAAGAVVAACLAGVIAAWMDAVRLMRAEHGHAPGLPQILGGVGLLLAAMGGAAVAAAILLAPRS